MRRADKEKAELLANAFSRKGWSVWWDREIPPGKSFDETIENALSSARCVVVLWSKTSVSSRWVKTEAAEGAERGILVPALIDNVKIPLEFKDEVAGVSPLLYSAAEEYLSPMARPLRLEFAGALYHLTSRGDHRREHILDDTDRRTFLELLGKEILQQHWLCYAWTVYGQSLPCPDRDPEAESGPGMRRLNGVYTQSFNRRHGRVGHVFQGRYKAILVDKENYLLELCRYIVVNPVRAKIATTAEKWPWSSYRATAGETVPPNWLATDKVVSFFPATDRVIGGLSPRGSPERRYGST